MIFPHCLLHDLPLLHARHKAVVNAKRYSVPVCKVSKVVLSISLDTFYSNKNYAARKI